jgi:hypothetical protein
VGEARAGRIGFLDFAQHTAPQEQYHLDWIAERFSSASDRPDDRRIGDWIRRPLLPVHRVPNPMMRFSRVFFSRPRIVRQNGNARAGPA